ncbi:hypothetical protein ACFX11_028112 [Malus domestica]
MGKEAALLGQRENRKKSGEGRLDLRELPAQLGKKVALAAGAKPKEGCAALGSTEGRKWQRTDRLKHPPLSV